MIIAPLLLGTSIATPLSVFGPLLQKPAERAQTLQRTLTDRSNLRPGITDLSHSTREGWLGAGAGIRVFLKGTPKSEGLLDIPGVVHSVPMKEVSPGSYTAQFTLRTANPVALEGARLIGCLRGSAGFSEPAVSPTVLRIDTAQPVIEEIYPKPSANVVRPRVPIVARITDHSGSGVAPEKARLILDQEDVTDSLIASNNLLTFLPGAELEPGEHSAHLMVFDRAGNMKSQSWSFNVLDTGGAIHAIITNADKITGAGETLIVNVEGRWNAQASLVLADSKEIPLKEQSPGFYEASYMLTQSDLAARIPLAVRMSAPGQRTATEAIEQSIKLPHHESNQPTITTPKASDVDSAVLRGRGSPRSTIRAITFFVLRLKAIDVSGILADQIIRVPSTGTWETRPLKPSPILARAGARFNYSVSVYTLAPISAEDQVTPP